MKRLTLLAALLACALPAVFAQDAALVTDIVATPNYFMAVVSGVIIAFAVQYLLTALSVAIGVSATPNLKHKYAEVKARDSVRGAASDDEATKWNEFSHEADETPLGVTISSGVGIWNTITTAVSLFAGTALALTLSPVLTTGIAITLALTIWGTFFMLLFWLESRFASTLVGGLISTATSGLKAAAQGVTNLVTPNPAQQVANQAQSVAEATIDKLQASFGGSFDSDRLAEAIEKFGQRVETAGQNVGNRIDDRLPSYDKLKADLREIMVDSSKAGKSNPAKWTAIQSVIQSAIASGDGSGTDKGKQKSSELQRLLGELKAEYDESGNAQQAAKTVAADNSDFDEAEIDGYIERLEETLRTSSDEDFASSERFNTKIQDIFSGDAGARGSSLQQLGSRLQQMDREQVATLVASNTSLSKQQVDSYIDQATQAIAMVREQLSSSATDEDATLLDVVQERAADLDVNAYVERAKAAIASYIQQDDSSGAMRDYSPLRRDLVRAMNNPGDTLDILRARIASFDPEAVLAKLPGDATTVDGYKADLTRTLNEAKAEVEQQAKTLETKARAAGKRAERRAVIEAEHARKTAIAAAWWLVVAIVVSGVAAIGGALV